MKRILIPCLAGIVIIACVVVLPGCEKNILQPSTQFVFPSPTPQAIGAATSIAWPLGPNEDPADWRGVDGDRTDGGWVNYCGGVNSHTGADYYARDLSRKTGTTAGKPLYAGITGLVVIAGNAGGYGKCVVIYDAAHRVAVRYAHLSSVSVSPGQNITIRALIGAIGNTPGGFAAHLHLAVYENIDHFHNGNPNDPVIPGLCDSDWYTCRVYFFC